MLMLLSQALKLGNATVNVVCATLLSIPCTITIACNYTTAHCFFHCEPLHQVVRSPAYFIRNIAQSCFAPCWVISLVLTQGRENYFVSLCSTKVPYLESS